VSARRDPCCPNPSLFWVSLPEAFLHRKKSGTSARGELAALTVDALIYGRRKSLDGSKQFLRFSAELATIRQQSRKIFDRFPQMRGNRHGVDLECRGHLAVTELCLRISERSSSHCQRRSASPPQVCQLSHGAPIFPPAGFKCRCNRLVSLSGVPWRVRNTKVSSSECACCPHARVSEPTSALGMGSERLLLLVLGEPNNPQ
jgi:hypothetical protein